MEMSSPTIIIDKKAVTIGDEINLLELIRKTGIELPTFCYNPELSVFGSCRMCLVDVEGRGLMPACSTKPEDGMKIRTNTKQVRDLRKMIIELMLASHDQECTTCTKSSDCRLQAVAKQLDVTNVRFKSMPHIEPHDVSSDAIRRDMSKCILCGDCVRACHEKQSVCALNFMYRGTQARVLPAFNKSLGESECVGCGQCVKVCPVGALTVKPGVNGVWTDLYNSEKTVVAQVAPSVRKALGEAFGVKPGVDCTGKIVSALKRMGFERVYDTSFSSDMVMAEVGREFTKRCEKNEKGPLFMSACPAWVAFCEEFYPELPGTLSACASPQQIFGSLCKSRLTKELGIQRENLAVVSFMPCAAKKREACLAKNAPGGNPDVDHVLTPKELIMMIEESGIVFNMLEDSPFDKPIDVAAGGGPGEAALKYLSKLQADNPTGDGIVTGKTEINGKKLSVAIVAGLANARTIINKVKSGEETYDLVKVMSCGDGCEYGAE